MKLGMISLGCSKNQVDSEMILGSLKDNFTLTTNEKDADLIIINTCAFIDSAKKEAIDEILNVSLNKKKNQKIVVCGCLAERYEKELKDSIPEVDRIIPLKDYYKFSSIIKEMFNIKEEELCFTNRVLISNPSTPYVRIADGCNNRCAFCAIPLIRGKYISRKIEDIIDEVKYLVSLGAKEINLIAQDTSKYGIDIYHKLMFPELLKNISNIDGVRLIRLFYMYPETITDELIDTIKTHKNIAPYFDIPFQHASNKILKSMDRHITKEKCLELINKIRSNIPDAVIRTTLMVGFPGEDEDDFNELIEFVKEAKFFHMGAFTYSREEDTKAYFMSNQVNKNTAKRRYRTLMKTQEEVALKLKESLVGNIYNAIVDDYDEKSFTYSLRSYHFAPDEVDGGIIATCPFENDIKIGDIVKVKILGASSYDLYGEIVK